MYYAPIYSFIANRRILNTSKSILTPMIQTIYTTGKTMPVVITDQPNKVKKDEVNTAKDDTTMNQGDKYKSNHNDYLPNDGGDEKEEKDDDDIDKITPTKDIKKYRSVTGTKKASPDTSNTKLETINELSTMTKPTKAPQFFGTEKQLNRQLEVKNDLIKNQGRHDTFTSKLQPDRGGVSKSVVTSIPYTMQMKTKNTDSNL
jgi:hypothetical protein